MPRLAQCLQNCKKVATKASQNKCTHKRLPCVHTLYMAT